MATLVLLNVRPLHVHCQNHPAETWKDSVSETLRQRLSEDQDEWSANVYEDLEDIELPEFMWSMTMPAWPLFILLRKVNQHDLSSVPKPGGRSL